LRWLIDLRLVTVLVITSVVYGCGGSGGSTSSAPSPAPVPMGDPLFADQWDLQNTGQLGFIGVDLNVVPVWSAGDKGEGVTVAVVDDGLEIAHPDLQANVVPGLSYNYTNGSNDPTGGEHGTAVAGIIAARDNNNLGGRGVAPRAGLVGYDAVADPTDANLEDAMVRNAPSIAVSNNSWGNPDGTGLLQNAPPGWQQVIDQGLGTGRGGLGTVYVWAAGNGATELGAGVSATPTTVDNANYDAFTNAHGVMAICSVDSAGNQGKWTSGPLAGYPYSEPGANLWVCAPGGGQDEGITTTDRSGAAGYNDGNSANDYADPDYTRNFEGTSAAAAMVSGVVALMLHANPNLSWRDVQIILAGSARMTDPADPDWHTNAAGYHYNPKYGFGLVDADAAVALAQRWTDVGPEVSYLSAASAPNVGIPDNSPTGVSNTITVSNSNISSLEWVQVTFTATSSAPRDLTVTLTHQGTVSQLAVAHNCPNTGSCSAYNGWVFGCAHDLGEAGDGPWTLQVVDSHTGTSADTGTFQSWQLKLYGH